MCLFDNAHIDNEVFFELMSFNTNESILVLDGLLHVQIVGRASSPVLTTGALFTQLHTEKLALLESDYRLRREGLTDATLDIRLRSNNRLMLSLIDLLGRRRTDAKNFRGANLQLASD